MGTLRLCVCLATCVWLTGCIERSKPSEGIVFAGPVNLSLHHDPLPKSKVVVVVHHGDKLDVVQQKRRLYKLRTASGIVGWTDERNLMNTQQMDALSKLEQSAKTLPSQGVASTYEDLNVHTEPQRFSPTFSLIRQGEKFDVIAHRVSGRAEPAHRVLVPPPPKAPPKARKKRGERLFRFVPPPPPAAPKPPADWEELSLEREPKALPPPAPVPDAPRSKKKHLLVPEVAPNDDWTLVRTSKGEAGWVLTSRLYLAIPDEVAQYAEGHRIVSYFSLGKIHDEERNADKDTWLWATVGSGEHPFDFDGFRVFLWNPRKHRYETTYQQRKIEGFLPVLVAQVEGRMTFSVCMAEDDGTYLRKRFAMVENRVRAADVETCNPKPAAAPVAIRGK